MTKKRQNTKPNAAPAKVPSDFATEVCNSVADELESLGERGELGQVESEFAASVLREVAAGRDPRKLIDGRVKMDGLRARVGREVERAIHEDGCGSWAAAFDIASARLGGINTRTIEGAWRAYEKARGANRAPPWGLKGEPPKRRPKGMGK